MDDVNPARTQETKEALLCAAIHFKKKEDAYRQARQNIEEKLRQIVMDEELERIRSRKR